MGWNSWNTFGEKISDKLIRQTADLMVDLGLDKAGYNYLVIDDCWSERYRDPKTHKLVPNKKKFPNGIKAVADYVHSKGLKFGIYSCCGVRTCANYPGSFDHEFLDADTFAEWGVDFLKYDFCCRPKHAYGPQLYRTMGHALRLCGREILFSACNWGSDDVWSWIRSAGAHMYRSTGDICDTFESFRKIATSQMDKLHASAPFCYNDMDMLTVGMYGKGNVGAQGCAELDYKTQFALWCMMGSPLMLGADLRNLTKKDPKYRNMMKLITNKELIAIDQDPEARPIFNCTISGEMFPTVCRLLANGDLAVAMFNFSDKEALMNVVYEAMGIPDAAGVDLHVRDVFSGEDCGVIREYFDRQVPAHDCFVFRCTPVRRK